MKPRTTPEPDAVKSEAAPGDSSTPFMASSQTNLYFLLMQAPVAIAIFSGPDYIIELANDLYLAIAGKTRAELLNKPAFEAIPAAASQGFIQLLDNIRATGQPQNLQEHETLIERAGQTETTYLNIVYQPVKEADGTVAKIMILVTDVTEQVLARRKLQESEEQFRIFGNNISNLAWIADGEGWIHWYNQRWYDYTGTTLEEMQGWGWEKVHHPDHINRVVNFVIEAWHKDEAFELTFPLRRHDGEYRWFLTRAVPIKDAAGKIYRWIGTNTDVHEQVESQRLLKETKEQLEFTFKNVPASIYLYDKTGTILYLNERGAKQLGYETVKDVLAEGDVYKLRSRLDETFIVLNEKGELVPPDQTSAAIALRTGKPAEVVTEFRHRKTGSSFWLLSKAAPLYDEGGALNMMLTTATDITAQKTSEQAIRESEERLNLVIEAARLGLWDYNIQTDRTTVSSRTREFYNLNTGEPFTFERFLSNIHPDDRYRVAAANKRVLFDNEGATDYHAEFRIVNKSGEVTWLRSIGKVLLNEKGERYRFTGAISDITKEKQATQILQHNEERFRTLAETLPQMIWVINADGEIEYTSKNWMEYTGLENTPENRTLIVHPDDRETASKAWAESLAEGRPYRIDLRLRNKNGVYRWHTSFVQPVKDATGRVIRWIGANTDIHDQKTFSDKLEKLVAQRTTELQRSNDDLQQFAHVASHDLKEPLRKIRTFGSRLSYEFGDSLPERAGQYLEKIEAAAARMYAMIDGVLHYSTVSTTEQPLEAIDLAETIHHIESDLEVVIQQKGAIIEHAQLPVIEGYGVLMHQLFYNLINNALKFSKAGVAPVIRLSSVLISGNNAGREWGLNRNTDYVQIMIQDNGIGFSQDQAERIFKTFTRLHAKDQYEGTGLGLALCKKIVERHNGVISAAGMQGAGAIFKVILPLQQPKKEE